MVQLYTHRSHGDGEPHIFSGQQPSPVSTATPVSTALPCVHSLPFVCKCFFLPLTSAGKALKAARPDLKIVLAEPEAAGLLKSGIETERQAARAVSTSSMSISLIKSIR